MKAERLAAEVVAAVQQHYGIAKSAGTTSMLMAAVLPLAETIAKQDRHIKRTTRQLRKHHKRLRAIGGSSPAAPWSAPARRMVDYRPQEWRTTLTPAAGAQAPRNGFHHDPDDDDGQGDGPWHDDLGGLS